jgi:hypothetical protein
MAPGGGTGSDVAISSKRMIFLLGCDWGNQKVVWCCSVVAQKIQKFPASFWLLRSRQRGVRCRHLPIFDTKQADACVLQRRVLIKTWPTVLKPQLKTSWRKLETPSFVTKATASGLHASPNAMTGQSELILTAVHRHSMLYHVH